jgi:hypothetical protein
VQQIYVFFEGSSSSFAFVLANHRPSDAQIKSHKDVCLSSTRAAGNEGKEGEEEEEQNCIQSQHNITNYSSSYSSSSIGSAYGPFIIIYRFNTTEGTNLKRSFD